MQKFLMHALVTAAVVLAVIWVGRKIPVVGPAIETAISG